MIEFSFAFIVWLVVTALAVDAIARLFRGFDERRQQANLVRQLRVTQGSLDRLMFRGLRARLTAEFRDPMTTRLLSPEETEWVSRNQMMLKRAVADLEKEFANFQEDKELLEKAREEQRIAEESDARFAREYASTRLAEEVKSRNQPTRMEKDLETLQENQFFAADSPIERSLHKNLEDHLKAMASDPRCLGH